jgi:vancomycin resistance protein YoaR
MSWRRWLGLIVIVPILGALGAGTAWGIDGWVHADRVPRNIELDGVPIGGMQLGELDAALDAAASHAAGTPVELRLPELVITAEAADVGLVVDRQATVQAIMDVDRGLVVDRFSSWITSYREPRSVTLRYEVDPAHVAEFVADHPHRVWREPVEPWFAAVEGRLEVQPPVAGLYLEPADVVAALWSAADAGPPFVADVPWSDRQPRFGQEDLDGALSDAATLARRVAVRVGERAALIGGETIRRWLRSEVTGNGRLTATIDTAAALEYLEGRLADLGTPGTPPVFTVVDGTVEYELGEPAMTCCGPEAGELLLELLRSEGGSVVLPTRLADEDGGVAAAEALGVEEVVGEFTTNHACCRARVQNIQRIADIVRGQLILPGESFSINEFVGPRTREKGFVAAGVIQNGHFDEGVGGGISQFATTMFNAAFFAGLELDDYQSHSIYISRYPYGREATMSFPKPDLRVTNTTPYAMLIWTSYTDTSITVQMYSTPYFDTAQTGQRSYKIRACTRVDTYRTRTAPDGTVLEDAVFATYRPGEGLDCNGNRTVKP